MFWRILTQWTLQLLSTNLPQTTNPVYINRVKQMQHMDDLWSEIQDMPGEIFDITELEENDSKMNIQLDEFTNNDYTVWYEFPHFHSQRPATSWRPS